MSFRPGRPKGAIKQLLTVIDLDLQLIQAKSQLKVEDLRHYQHLRGRGLTPVGTIVQLVESQRGALCSACNQFLPTAFLSKYRAGAVMRCENCARFLVSVRNFSTFGSELRAPVQESRVGQVYLGAGLPGFYDKDELVRL